MQKFIFEDNKFFNKLAKIDVRFLLLICLLIVLPALEAPKNIFAFLFVVVWAIIARKKHYWGGKWHTIDSIFLLWILFDVVISINAIINHQLAGEGFRDVVRFVLIGWTLSRINFTNERLTQSAIAAIVAVVLTLIYSYYAGQGNLKELYSVGHINHTAIYLAIAYSISLALLLFNFNNISSYQKIILFVTSVALFIATIDTHSRAAFGLIILITLINFIYLSIRVKKLSLIFGLVVILMGIGISFFQNPPVALQRLQAYESIFDFSTRKPINEFSYYAFKTNPFFGVGFKNYSQITLDDIEDAVIRDKKVFEKHLYFKGSHAHNVYFNYLVSGGLLIFSIFAWFWFYIFWVIIKSLKNRENDWIILSSVGVVLVNLGIGLVNTTLHHEHAILSMYILGLLLSKYRNTQ
jgi:O-antigen ligase